jgi:hypothetical protein
VLQGVKDAREKSNEETSEDTAPKPYSAPNSDTESAGDYQVVIYPSFVLLSLS